MRLVDADKVVETLKMYCKGCNNYDGIKCSACNIYDAICTVEDEPTAVYGEFVHCEECKHWKDSPITKLFDPHLISDSISDSSEIKECEIGGYLVGKNGYCTYGEKNEVKE